jgi:DNA polymerase III subunit epsilon
MQTSSTTTRQLAIETARKVLSANPVYLDTETTGLGRDDEIIEISIVDDLGAVVFESLVRPSKPIPPESTRIHQIRDEDVQAATPWPIIWQQVRMVLANRLIVMYNQDFDMRMMQQTHGLYRMPWKERLNAFDLMKLYAQFRGEWDATRRAYRFHSLAAAGKSCAISLPNAHRATADTLLTRALLHYIAEGSA